MRGAAAAAAALLSLSVLAPAQPPIRVDGRFFVIDSRTFRPVFASGLSLLMRSAAERARFLDEVAALGFNGVRVFAGALQWAGQTPTRALDVLPVALEEARQRGLHVEVTAITDSATGYDVESHLRRVAAVCARASNCLLEAANEYYHPTQSELVRDPSRFFDRASRAVAGTTWALGAPPFDRPQQGKWPVPSGDYVTVHLDRGGTSSEQLARLRDVARISELTGKPVLNNEPIGAAEAPQRGRRASDPHFFFALGALSRLFELGAVFHSESGLHAQKLGPVQRRAAEAFVAGFKTIATAERLTSVDAGASTSPIASAAARHVFAARTATVAFVTLLEVQQPARIQWRPGWSQLRELARRPGLLVVEARYSPDR